jgi:Flp pilus assembly protein TadG
MPSARPARDQAERAPTASAASTQEVRAIPPERGRRGASDGQVLVIFVLSIFVLMSICAVVIDVSWYWANTLRVQRAADAAALAGVVDLPGNPPQALIDAASAARQNGYALSSSCTASNAPTSVPGMCAYPDSPTNNRQLDVTLSAPVNTFFMRLIGINSITASRTSKAKYELPVPMGSPLAYYGVYQLCGVNGTCTAEPDAVSGTLPSQGFFGAIEGEGSNRSTGDAFAPYYDGKPTVNAQYPLNGPYGYDYTVVVPAGGATVWIFDPTFCATATKSTGSGHAGAGDHWFGPGSVGPVSTYYQLWNTHNQPLNPSVWTEGPDSGSLFVNEYQIDKSSTYGSTNQTLYDDQGVTPPSSVNGHTLIDCQAGKITNPAVGGYWHNKWWALASNVAAGTYFVRVMTTDPSNQPLNLGQSFENMFSLEVTGGVDTSQSPPVGPQVYGGGKMATYANIDSGAQSFYLAQITQAVGAGKTMEIDLFDPGDVGQNAWLQILSPDANKGGSYNTPDGNYATFSFTADSNASGPRSGTNVNCIQTYRPSSGGAPPAGCTSYVSTGATGTFYNNSWVTILINLPSTYGQNGLQPPNNAAPAWWKIKYTVQSANDTTTWMVSVRGNPVHLVVP